VLSGLATPYPPNTGNSRVSPSATAKYATQAGTAAPAGAAAGAGACNIVYSL